jgi:hypothetical protein
MPNPFKAAKRRRPSTTPTNPSSILTMKSSMADPQPSVADLLQAVPALYGPGAMYSWLLTYITVLLGWILDGKSVLKDGVSANLMATLLIPLLASGHLMYLEFRYHVALPSLDHAEVLLKVVAIEATRQVLKSLTILIFVASLCQVKKTHYRTMIVEATMQACLSSIAFTKVVSAFSSSARVETIFVVYLAVVVYLLVDPRLVTMMRKRRRGRFPAAAKRRGWRIPIVPDGLEGVFQRIVFLIFYLRWCKPWYAEDVYQALVFRGTNNFLVPKSNMSIADLDQTAAILAGTIPAIWGLFRLRKTIWWIVKGVANIVAKKVGLSKDPAEAVPAQAEAAVEGLPSNEAPLAMEALPADEVRRSMEDPPVMTGARLSLPGQ